MMQHGAKLSVWQIACDFCSSGHAEYDAGAITGSFPVCLEAFKQCGWRIIPKLSGATKVWRHKCPDCVALEKRVNGRLI